MNKEQRKRDITEKLASLKGKITQGKEDVKALADTVQDMKETLTELKNHLAEENALPTH